MTDQSIEEIIDIIQQHINNTDKSIADIPPNKASEIVLSYYRGLRLGFTIAQQEIIETQIKQEMELKHGRE